MRIYTEDPCCGAYLTIHRAHLVELSVDRVGGRPAYTFVFEERDDLRAHQEAYVRGEARARPAPDEAEALAVPFPHDLPTNREPVM